MTSLEGVRANGVVGESVDAMGETGEVVEKVDVRLGGCLETNVLFGALKVGKGGLFDCEELMDTRTSRAKGARGERKKKKDTIDTLHALVQCIVSSVICVFLVSLRMI